MILYTDLKRDFVTSTHTRKRIALMENLQFRKAIASDLPFIWDILKQAISRRKKDGSNQWQDGYPNPRLSKEILLKAADSYY